MDFCETCARCNEEASGAELRKRRPKKSLAA
jgi:hypothetical protein